MRRFFILALVLLGILASSASSATMGTYAYRHHDVLVHQMRLNYVFRQLPVFRNLGIHAYCSGEAPVKLTDGARGYFRIRCTTNGNMPDFLYRLDSTGREHMKRVAPK
jgi:hypothetical protein